MNASDFEYHFPTNFLAACVGQAIRTMGGHLSRRHGLGEERALSLVFKDDTLPWIHVDGTRYDHTAVSGGRSSYESLRHCAANAYGEAAMHDQRVQKEPDLGAQETADLDKPPILRGSTQHGSDIYHTATPELRKEPDEGQCNPIASAEGPWGLEDVSVFVGIQRTLTVDSERLDSDDGWIKV